MVQKTNLNYSLMFSKKKEAYEIILLSVYISPVIV
jgi:hypothetical protein